MTTIADRLMIARQKKELTQIKVKEITAINNKTLSSYERGISEPDLDSLVVLANLYDVSCDWLLMGAGRHLPAENDFKETKHTDNITETVIQEYEWIMKCESCMRLLSDDAVIISIQDPLDKRKRSFRPSDFKNRIYYHQDCCFVKDINALTTTNLHVHKPKRYPTGRFMILDLTDMDEVNELKRLISYN